MEKKSSVESQNKKNLKGQKHKRRSIQQKYYPNLDDTKTFKQNMA